MRRVEAWLVCAGAALMSLASPSADAAGPGICAIKTRSPQLIVLICSADAGDQVWRVRSQAACAERSSCNVWIWEERAKAPEIAPARDAELSLFQTDAAVAVWINESQTLVKLRTRR